MTIILAPDKFKGSLTGLEFCNIVSSTLKQYFPEADIIYAPLADGGDGTIEVINFYLKGNLISVEVNDPVFRPIKANFLFSEYSKTAYVELAESSGLKLLKGAEQNCMYTSTYGCGELILEAINRGAKHILVGIGGSATNDCGIGMANALGYRFLDKKGKELKPIGKNLIEIAKIDSVNADPRLKQVKIEVACDVANPLYGSEGAAKVYAKQKGASEEEIEYLNEGLKHVSIIIDNHFNIKTQNIEGAGAAGGMGAGTVAFLNAKLISGIDLIKKIADFNDVIKNADWIITGEGQLDAQTMSGKTISGVIDAAQEQQVSVAVFCGAYTTDSNSIKHMGIKYIDAVMNYANSFEDAILNTKGYLREMSVNFGKWINTEV